MCIYLYNAMCVYNMYIYIYIEIHLSLYIYVYMCMYIADVLTRSYSGRRERTEARIM